MLLLTKLPFKIFHFEDTDSACYLNNHLSSYRCVFDLDHSVKYNVNRLDNYKCIEVSPQSKIRCVFLERKNTAVVNIRQNVSHFNISNMQNCPNKFRCSIRFWEIFHLNINITGISPSVLL